ncbi:hypothetical protein RMCBS344292_14923 [Rhizopus microsporus]|nr:hypothetical protein RMCBS344292_14923 [Rhizopus microsporus]
MSTLASHTAPAAHTFSNTEPDFLLPNKLNKDDTHDNRLFDRLQEENARLPPQESTAFILAQIERQNALLEKDPKSIFIHSNELRAHFSTLQRLVKDNIVSLNEEEEIDWGFWEAVIQDSDQVALRLPHLLSLKLRSGIPARVRGLIWQAMSKSASLHLETVYGQLCQERSPHERIIQRDLARTFPRIELFKQENGSGQTAMKRILEAYSLYDTEVGYCQGLAFLVGPLLMNIDSLMKQMPEVPSFCVFVRLMETYEMRSMFTLHMEGLQLRLYQFSKLLHEILPDLSYHFMQHGVHAAMYASQWFLTLFAYALPMELVNRIYDIIFAEGAAETIMRIAIAMLKKSADHIISKLEEFEDILDFVTSRKLCLPYAENYGNVIRDAVSLSHIITKEKLDVLHAQYVADEGEHHRKLNSATGRLGMFWKRKKKTRQELKRSSTMYPAKIQPSKPPLRKRWSSVSAKDTATPLFVAEEASSIQRRLSISSFCSCSSIQNQSLPSTPQSLTTPYLSSNLQLEIEHLRKDHQKALDELQEMRYDKEDLECERDALKLTILELERRYCLEKIDSSNRISPDLALQQGFEGENSMSTLKSLEVAENVQSYADDMTSVLSKVSTCLSEEVMHTKNLEQQCEKLSRELEHVQSKFDMVNEGQMALVDRLLVMKAEMDELAEEKKRKEVEWTDAIQKNKALEKELEKTRKILEYFKLENQYLICHYPTEKCAINPPTASQCVCCLQYVIRS